MKTVRLMNGVTVKKKAWANHVIICLRRELINYICCFMDLIVVLSPLKLHLLYTHNLKTLCSEYWKHLPVPIWMLTILGAHPFSGFLQGLFSCFLLFSKIFLFSCFFSCFTVYPVFSLFSSKNFDFSGTFLHGLPTGPGKPGKPWKTNQFYLSQGELREKIQELMRVREKSGIFFIMKAVHICFLSFFFSCLFFFMGRADLASYFWNRAWMVIFLSGKALVCWVFHLFYPSYNIFLAHMALSMIMSKLPLVFPPDIFYTYFLV